MSHEDERIEELEDAIDATRDRLAAAEERAERAEERARVLGGDLAFWHEEAHAAREWLGRLMERGCVPEEWQRYVAQFADATPTPRRTAEREAVIEAAREVVYQGDLAWRKYANDIRALGSHVQYFVLPEINRLRRMLSALDATDSEGAPADTKGGAVR